MSRLKERMMATLLIAIFMVSMMTFVVGAQPKNDYNTITEGARESSSIRSTRS